MFINTETFEEMRVAKDELPETSDFIADGQTVTIVKFGERVVTVYLPTVIECKVVA